jgi:DNA polymerase epsilon subunit 2
MSDRQRTIIKVNTCRITLYTADPHIPQVFRKYSHSLGPDALEFLEDILEKHHIADEDVEYSVELIAKEYNKQDGASLAYSCVLSRAHSPYMQTRS